MKFHADPDEPCVERRRHWSLLFSLIQYKRRLHGQPRNVSSEISLRQKASVSASQPSLLSLFPIMPSDDVPSNGTHAQISAIIKLRRIIEDPKGFILCPGVNDGFSARIALGFDGLYMISLFPTPNIAYSLASPACTSRTRSGRNSAGTSSARSSWTRTHVPNEDPGRGCRAGGMWGAIS